MKINDKLKTILAKLRSHFEQLYGDRLTQMVLYGSQARGDADPDSDIDVLVVLKGQVNPGEEGESHFCKYLRRGEAFRQ